MKRIVNIILKGKSSVILTERLMALKKALEEVEFYREDNVIEIIKFFNIVSFFQDQNEELIIKMIKKKRNRDLLEKLLENIRDSGRNKYGINRTEKGQKVTINNVFLGGIFGLFTQPAYFWLERKGKSEWNIINDFCRDFVINHKKSLTEIIDKLLTTK